MEVGMGYYIKGLTQGGIKLLEHLDKLMWTHNPKNGVVSASLTYDLIVSSSVISLKGILLCQRYGPVIYHSKSNAFCG